ncbi:hypothetical protein [Planotetraspora phitsanulokensis]|uniref:Uncharacterized protein n=1 Tax=Planotetraspora phitsanulokensis TaxID=575192 RepID=A0A8J3UI68_9ACTN|nr:hypothetical protein [Planotetraspora phitsanulokensis]GII42749.1 hypothetical protein Pph01_77520 [Planotetraspora phitsanulokensis]
MTGSGDPAAADGSDRRDGGRFGAQKIVYAGGSLGGSVALVTAADPATGAAGVISLSGGLDGQEQTVKRLTVPALYVVTEVDTTGVTDLVKDLHKATPKGRSTLAVYPWRAACRRDVP